MGEKYEDPVADLPFSTRSLQMEKLDLPTTILAPKSRTKFTEEQSAMMTITGLVPLWNTRPAASMFFLIIDFLAAK